MTLFVTISEAAWQQLVASIRNRLHFVTGAVTKGRLQWRRIQNPNVRKIPREKTPWKPPVNGRKDPVFIRTVSVSLMYKVNLGNYNSITPGYTDWSDIDALSGGWERYFHAKLVNVAPHFESYLWACYLWVADGRTRYNRCQTRAIWPGVGTAQLWSIRPAEDEKWVGRESSNHRSPIV